MDIELTEVEARVLGSLVEKQLTTPEYYPLSLNALAAACNQKTNRNPVMSLSESDILNALDSLRGKRLAWELKTAAGRVTKYEHNLTPRWELSPQEVAVLCVLLLRSAQTAGEIRGRTGRMFEFESIAAVEETLERLAQREDGPFVVMLPRQAGAKESRYMHLFCGMPDIEDLPAATHAPAAAPAAQADLERITALEDELAMLRDELKAIRERVADLERRLDAAGA